VTYLLGISKFGLHFGLSPANFGLMTKKVKNSPVYTYDYPVHDYEDNSVYLVIYCNGKNIKSLKNEDAQWLLEALKIWESPEDIQALLSSYHY